MSQIAEAPMQQPKPPTRPNGVERLPIIGIFQVFVWLLLPVLGIAILKKWISTLPVFEGILVLALLTFAFCLGRLSITPDDASIYSLARTNTILIASLLTFFILLSFPMIVVQYKPAYLVTWVGLLLPLLGCLQATLWWGRKKQKQSAH